MREREITGRRRGREKIGRRWRRRESQGDDEPEEEEPEEEVEAGKVDEKRN